MKTPLTTPTKQKPANKVMVSPQKQIVLGERGDTDKAIKDALNTEVSPEELQAWAKMSMNLVNMDTSTSLTSNIQYNELDDQGEIGDARADDDAEVRRNEGGEEERNVDIAPDPSKQQNTKVKSKKVNTTNKPSQK